MPAMTEITATLEQALEKHDVQVKHHLRSTSNISDEFLKEAYRINSHVSSLHNYLRSIRQAYLSTSFPPHRKQTALFRNSSSTSAHSTHPSSKDRKYFTDSQRDQIDAESKATLRDLSAGIRQLEETEQLRQNTERRLSEKQKSKNGFKALGRWAAGGAGGEAVKSPEEQLEESRQETVRVHRESVIWYLRKKLEEVAEVQMGMMQTRLEREVEKSKSVLYKTKGINGTSLELGGPVINGTGNGKASKQGGDYDTALDRSASKDGQQVLNSEQMQLFAEENNEMLKHYEDTIDKVRTAERSLLEISSLQTTLAANLSTQSAAIDQLVIDSQATEQDVAGGNKELKGAAERKGPARWVFRATCGFCLFLVVWDFFI